MPLLHTCVFWGVGPWLEVALSPRCCTWHLPSSFCILSPLAPCTLGWERRGFFQLLSGPGGFKKLPEHQTLGEESSSLLPHHW